MPTGLKIPVRVNEKGRAAVETNESANTLKILVLAFQEVGDDNPFLDLGIDKRIIFSVNNVGFQSKVIRVVTRTLARFSELVRLDENRPIKIEDGPEDGEVLLSFFYIDLLTSKSEEFRTQFTR